MVEDESSLLMLGRDVMVFDESSQRNGYAGFERRG